MHEYGVSIHGNQSNVISNELLALYFTQYVDATDAFPLFALRRDDLSLRQKLERRHVAHIHAKREHNYGKIRSRQDDGGQCRVSKHRPKRLAYVRLFSGVAEQRGLLKYSKSF